MDTNAKKYCRNAGRIRLGTGWEVSCCLGGRTENERKRSGGPKDQMEYTEISDGEKQRAKTGERESTDSDKGPAGTDKSHIRRMFCQDGRVETGWNLSDRSGSRE